MIECCGRKRRRGGGRARAWTMAVMLVQGAALGVGVSAVLGAGGAEAKAQSCIKTEYVGNPGERESIATAASQDGETVVGWWVDSGGRGHAFRWTAADGLREVLGPWVLRMVLATDTSDDGQVVVGYGLDARNVWGVFHWSATSGATDLNLRGATTTLATAVSPDGGVVVGWASFTGSTRSMAYRWSATGGTQFLETPPDFESFASGVATRGRVVVGHIRGGGAEYAVRWIEDGTLETLGGLGGSQARATGASGSGDVVVGWAMDADEVQRPFRWTRQTGLIALSEAGVDGSRDAAGEATAVSDDGATVVGWVDGGASGQRAFVWTPARGMQVLPSDSGVSAAAALHVSGDGGTVVGRQFAAGVGNRATRWQLQCRCATDIASADGAERPDGAVTFDDAVLYLQRFEREAATADVDNGTWTGIPDGAISIEDLLYFLERYELGC